MCARGRADDDGRHARTTRQPLRRATAAHPHHPARLRRPRGRRRRPGRRAARVRRRLHAPTSSESSRADGSSSARPAQETSPGIVLLVGGSGGGLEQRAQAAAARARRRARRRRAPRRPAVSEDGRSALVTGTIARERGRGGGRRRGAGRLRGRPDVTVGGSGGRRPRSSARRSRRTSARAELLAFPLLLLLSLLFFRGRAAILPLVVGITTVLGTFLVLTGVNQVYGLNVFALNLVIGPRARPGDRLHAVPRHPLPRGARRTAREPRAAVRTTMAHRRAHRRLLGRDRRRRARRR